MSKKSSDVVVLHMEKSAYMDLLTAARDVSLLFDNLTIKDDVDDQIRFDTRVRVDNIKRIAELPMNMDVQQRSSKSSEVRFLNDYGVRLVRSIKQGIDEQTKNGVIKNKSASKDILREALKIYIKENKLEREKGFVYDRFLKDIASCSTGRLRSEDLNVERSKRDITGLIGCLIEKDK